MNRLCRKIVICAFIFYLGSTGFTRYDEYRSYYGLTRVLSSLPLNDFPLKYIDKTNMIKTQIGVLSTSDVIQLLETNPVTFPHMQDGLSLTDIDLPPSERDYLVIRFNNGCGSSYFNVKYYFSHFPYAINFNTYSGNSYPNYYNIIIPYPEFLNKNPKDPEEVFMRWKSMY